MRLLLDTHVWLWMIAALESLGDTIWKSDFQSMQSSGNSMSCNVIVKRSSEAAVRRAAAWTPIGHGCRALAESLDPRT